MRRPNGKGIGVCGTNPPETFKSQPIDSASGDRDGKALATMRARAAQCGCTLLEMADGEYLVACCNYSKAVPCLRAVGDLLRRIGGRQ